MTEAVGAGGWGRSPIANLLTRVSGLLRGQPSTPPQPPPAPTRPWVDARHLTIPSHFWSSPGDLALKVRRAARRAFQQQG